MNDWTNVNQLTDCVLLAMIDRLGTPQSSSAKLWSYDPAKLNCCKEVESNVYEIRSAMIEVWEEDNMICVVWDTGSTMHGKTDGRSYIDIEAVLDMEEA